MVKAHWLFGEKKEFLLAISVPGILPLGTPALCKQNETIKPATL
jgi:hypothetical protein